MPHSLSEPENPGLVRDLDEGPVPLIVKEAIGAVASDVDVVEAVIVVVADTRPLAPSRRGESGFYSDVGKGSVMVVMKEMVGGCLGLFFRQVVLFH